MPSSLTYCWLQQLVKQSPPHCVAYFLVAGCWGPESGTSKAVLALSSLLDRTFSDFPKSHSRRHPDRGARGARAWHFWPLAHPHPPTGGCSHGCCWSPSLAFWAIGWLLLPTIRSRTFVQTNPVSRLNQLENHCRSERIIILAEFAPAPWGEKKADSWSLHCAPRCWNPALQRSVC